MIVSLVAGKQLHRNRSFTDASNFDTKGGELAETVEGVMSMNGKIQSAHSADMIYDAFILGGEYKNLWVCVGVKDFSEVSPLELLAMQAE